MQCGYERSHHGAARHGNRVRLARDLRPLMPAVDRQEIITVAESDWT